MNRILASLLLLAGISAPTEQDLEAAGRFRERQRKQPRQAGSMRRSVQMLPLALGKLARGTRAKNRGPYPQHLIDNCSKMRARNGVA